MSQDRMDGGGLSPAKPVTSFTAPDISSTLSRATTSNNKVRIVHGANEGYYSLEGKTVGNVRKSLKEVFNIPKDAAAVINGKEVGDDFILEGGQNLEFTKEAGVKGIIDYGPPSLTSQELESFMKRGVVRLALETSGHEKDGEWYTTVTAKVYCGDELVRKQAVTI